MVGLKAGPAVERAGMLTQGLRALLPAALPDWPPGGAAV